MNAQKLEPGDTIYATQELRNDGSIPGLPENELIAKAGTRGVLVNIGHLEEQPDVKLYLVKFENENLDLGPEVGCWPEEIRGVEPNDEILSSI